MNVSRAQRGWKGSGQGSLEPIRLPTEALEAVFGFLPRPERERLVLISAQTADAIVPGVNAGRQKVSPAYKHSLLLWLVSSTSI